ADRPRVIHPRRVRGPAVLLALFSLGVFDRAFARLVGADGVVDAHAHAAFLRVAERDRADPGVAVDPENDQSRFAQVVPAHHALLVHDLGAVSGAPFVMRRQVHAEAFGFGRADLGAHHFAVAVGFGPKINARDAADLVLQLDAFGDDVAVAEP